MLLDAHFGLAFAAAPPLTGLTLQHTVTRRLIMQKARGHTLRGAATPWPPCPAEAGVGRRDALRGTDPP